MSAEARKRISQAQKARWAKQKGEVPSTAPAEATAVAAKPKRGSRGIRKGAANGSPKDVRRSAKKNFLRPEGSVGQAEARHALAREEPNAWLPIGRRDAGLGQCRCGA